MYNISCAAMIDKITGYIDRGKFNVNLGCKIGPHLCNISRKGKYVVGYRYYSQL